WHDTGRGPAVTITAGLLALIEPMSWAGTVLSQPPIRTTPSIGETEIISSTSMDMRFRKYRLVGRVNGSEIEIVGNSRGNPPASRIPLLTSLVRLDKP